MILAVVSDLGLALGLVAATSLGARVAEKTTPGLVVLVGAGGQVDADIRAEIATERRLLLCVGPRESAPDPLAADGKAAERVVLDPAARRAGDARGPADRVRQADCIVLTGGGYMDWYWLLTPGGGTTRLSEAIRESHAAGVCVVGAGAAAPFLAEWSMVERSALPEPERNPRRLREHVPVEGLGLLGGVFVDSSACAGGSPARLIGAAFENNVRNVVFLDGPVVWVGNVRGRSARVRGTGTAIVLDLFRARRQRDAWREGRVSFLGAGDSWTARYGAACAEPTAAATAGGLDPRAESLRTSLAAVSASLIIRSDEFTRFRPASGSGPGGACGLCFDLEWAAR